ncbi:MAG: hypothetical protein ACRDYC_01145 [Acidimicrobiales bacterium]
MSWAWSCTCGQSSQTAPPPNFATRREAAAAWAEHARLMEAAQQPVTWPTD